MKAIFFRKEPSFENAVECKVEKVIILSDAEYGYFAGHLLKEYDFIRENVDLMYEENGVWHCLLVTTKDGEDGILVESEGAGYARYAAPVPCVSGIIEQLKREQAGDQQEQSGSVLGGECCQQII